jgi:outer membrane lipoprotein-sorting protein
MKHLTTIILSFLCISGFSQKDADATVLLEEVSAKASACRSIKADFTYTMDNKQARIHETKTGTLIISGDKYRLMAAGQTVICDGKIVWTYIRESNEVQINDLENQDDAMTPSKLLTSYTANYKSRVIEDSKVTDPSLEAIELIPHSTKNFTKAILIINKKEKQVREFRLFDKNGNTFTYSVSKYQTDLPVSMTDFIFDESNFPGVEIIDMR